MTSHVQRLLLLLIVITILTSCVVEEARPELVDPAGHAAYVHPSGVFQISLPPTWIVNDTSDEQAISVDFSPPNSPEPLLSVFVINSVTLDPNAINDLADIDASANDPAIYNQEALITTYLTRFYTRPDATYREFERLLQPDGSTRIKFVLEGANILTQHNDFIELLGPYFVALRVRVPAEDSTQMHTLTQVINSYQMAEEAEWASADSSSGQSTGADTVGFNSLYTWTDTNGSYQIMGQIVNNSPGALEFVRVAAQVYNASNQVLLERDDFISSDMVLPGEFAPFTIAFPEGLPAEAVRYELHASARYADFTRQTFYGGENLALTSAASFDDNDLLVISGQVRNEGGENASLVKVIVTVFDEQQRVIGTDTTLVDEQTLAPGDLSSYAVTFVELGGTPATFQVTAQGVVGEAE